MNDLSYSLVIEATEEPATRETPGEPGDGYLCRPRRR